MHHTSLYCLLVSVCCLVSACSSLPQGQTEQVLHLRAAEAKELFNLGEENTALGSYVQAESYFHKALEANAAIDNQNGVAECHNALASLYLMLNDPEGAIKNFTLAIAAAKQANNPSLVAKSTANVAKAYLSKGQAIEALELLDTAETLLPATGQDADRNRERSLLLAIIQHNRGTAQLSLNDLKAARQSFQAALKLNIESGALRERAANYYMLARIDYRSQEYISARTNLLLALDIDKDAEHPRGIADDLYALHLVERALNNQTAAYDWLKRSFRTNLANNYADLVQRDLELLLALAEILQYPEDKAQWQDYLGRFKAATSGTKQSGEK